MVWYIEIKVYLINNLRSDSMSYKDKIERKINANVPIVALIKIGKN